MTVLVLRDLLAYSSQIAVLITAGGLLLGLLKLQVPFRLWCLQGLLACCILLPLIQPWPVARAATPGYVSVRTFELSKSTASNGQTWLLTWPEALVAVIVAGAVIQLAFVLLGLYRLSRYRKEAQFVPAIFQLEKQRVGVWPDVYISEEVNGPVTFGVFRPAILVPSRWTTDEAVALHELIHVARRDWTFTLFEELLRALLWFHPAVWWLIGQIQLAREEAVDRAVVEYTLSRGQYLRTLLAMAEARADIGLAQAPLFLKKRHLRERVAALIEEVNMSELRIRSSMAGFAAIVIMTGWLGVRGLPLRAAPQSVTDATGVTVQVDEAKLLHRSSVQYPKKALANGIQGTVIIEATLDKKGEVTDARVASGPQELRGAALESVLQWHFNPEVQPSPAQIEIDFALPSEGAAEGPRPVFFQVPPGVSKVQDINVSSLPEPLRSKVLTALPIHKGDDLTPENFAQIQAALKDVDEHLGLAVIPAKDGNGLWLRVALPAASPSWGVQPPGKVIRIGGAVAESNLIHRVDPVYPPLAKAARIQGSVEFKVTVDKSGHVANIELVRGHPLLVNAAKNAVIQWVYRPTLLNGNPVDVQSDVIVTFALPPDGSQ